MNSAMERLEKLVTSLHGHAALNNEFYNIWESRALRIEQLQLVARNYGAFVEAFPGALGLLIATVDKTAARLEYTKTLFSEMGYGDSQKTHSRLFYAFFGQLAERLGAAGALDHEVLIREVELLATTRKFIDGERSLYCEEGPATAVGAQLALEWQAYTMLRRLYEGARNYMYLWQEQEQDGFHEACEYFYAHLGEAEKDHKVESMKAAEQYADSDDSLLAIEFGFRKHLELFAEFWNGLAVAVQEVELKTASADSASAVAPIGSESGAR